MADGGLPPGGGNNPHRDREIEAGKRADASSAFEEQGDSKRARLIESVIHAEYSRIPSLQRLAYNAVPNDQQVPPIMLPSIYPPWGSWRPPPIQAQPGSGVDYSEVYTYPFLTGTSFSFNNDFLMDRYRQRSTREGQVVPAGTYVDYTGVWYQYDEGDDGTHNNQVRGYDDHELCTIS